MFVTAPPDIWYLKDTDGDFRADVRKKVYTGFGTQNQQAMVNNLAWGLDHWIYGAASGNGGTIRPGDDPRAPGVSVEHSDFRFDPETGAFELVSGNDQFGNTFDDWGNRFICDESHPLSQPVLPRRELARNPYLRGPDGGAGHRRRLGADLPDQPGRDAGGRSARAGGSPTACGPPDRRASATMSSTPAAGVTVYRGSAYPAEFYGNVFVGDAQNNLIHRRILVPDGPTFKAVRGPRERPRSSSARRTTGSGR